MSFLETVALGAIAGLTIFLGLPLGRVKRVDDRLRVGLAMFSVGILAFIFMDVTKHGEEILETAVAHYKAHTAGFGHMLGLFALLAVGFTAGTAGISAVERRLRARRPAPAPIAGGEADGRAQPAGGHPLAAGRQWRPAAGTADGHGDRGRDRPAQLRRGSRDRRLG